MALVWVYCKYVSPSERLKLMGTICLCKWAYLYQASKKREKCRIGSLSLRGRYVDAKGRVFPQQALKKQGRNVGKLKLKGLTF